MASVTHSEFGADTEGVQVAEAFAQGIRGKTVLVTGGNRHGLGFSAAQAIASQSPALIILAGRTVSKVQECIDALRDEFPNVGYRTLQVDLSSQESVREAAGQVLAWDDVPAINLVINSAGVMGVQQRTLTADGIELTFATNHVGHWLLTCLVMPKLISAAGTAPRGATRIVNVSSGSPTVASMRWSDVNFGTRNGDLPPQEQPPYRMLEAWGYSNAQDEAYIPLDSYNRSKVANVLFGIAANRRLFARHGILSVAVHPGVIKTNLGRNFPRQTLDALDAMTAKDLIHWKSFAAGSSTTLVAALDPKLAVGVGVDEPADAPSENRGSFLADCQICDNTNPLAVSSLEADKLWDLSEKLTGQKFAW